MKLFALLTFTIFIYTNQVRSVPLQSDNSLKQNDSDLEVESVESVELKSDEPLTSMIIDQEVAEGNEELKKREKKSPHFRRFGRFVMPENEQMEMVAGPNHHGQPPPPPGLHHSYQLHPQPPPVHHHKPVHHPKPPHQRSHEHSSPMHYNHHPASQYREFENSAPLIGSIYGQQPAYVAPPSQPVYGYNRPQPTYAKPQPPHYHHQHHHQQPNYAAPQSSCGSNLLVGCQPHVQQVPCSSSYAHAAPAYPVSIPSYQQPLPSAPAYPVPALQAPAYAPQLTYTSQPQPAYSPSIAPYRAADQQSEKVVLGSPNPSDNENKPTSSGNIKPKAQTNQNAYESSDQKQSSKGSKTDAKPKNPTKERENVGEPKQETDTQQGKQPQPEPMKNANTGHLENIRKFKEEAEQKLRESLQPESKQKPQNVPTLEQPGAHGQLPQGPQAQPSQGTQGQLQPNPSPNMMLEPNPPQPLHAPDVAAANPINMPGQPMDPMHQQQPFVAATSHNLAPNTAGGSPIQNAYYSRNTVW